jgi:hypothetical protein
VIAHQFLRDARTLRNNRRAAVIPGRNSRVTTPGRANGAGSAAAIAGDEVRLLAVCALLVLWDIDHTLTENHGVNKEIYALAFELLTGRHAEHPARTDGRTEPKIMRNMLAAHGIEAGPGYLARVQEALVSATESKARTLRERGHELPGARAALAAFQASPGIVQSVLTGNIRPNAVTKLSGFRA